MHTSNTSIVGFYGSPHDNITFYGAVRLALSKGYSLEDIALSLKPSPAARNPEMHLHSLSLSGDVLRIHTCTDTAEISPGNRFKTTLEWLVSQEGAKRPMFELDEISMQISDSMAITVLPNLLQSTAHSFTLESQQLLTASFGMPPTELEPSATELRLTVTAHIPYKAASRQRTLPTWESSGHTTPIPQLIVDLQVRNPSGHQGPANTP